VHLRDLVDQRLAFGVRQLVGMGNRLGCGAAMLAGQVTGLRDLQMARKGVSSKFNRHERECCASVA